MVDELKLARRIEQWRNCDPRAMATQQSSAAIEFALADERYGPPLAEHIRRLLSRKECK